MATPLLTTKLYIPRARPELIPRPRLTERLNAGLQRKLTLVSAPAGFGKTTLLSEWIHGRGEVTLPLQVAWLSLDEGDNDPARFLAYFVAALQTVEAGIGEGVLTALQSPGVAGANTPPPLESLLTTLINDLAATSQPFVLVLDDYHLIEAQPIHQALTFLLANLPPQMHLVIAGRSDPPLSLARLRGQGQLTELRDADLRFTPDEAAVFLNEVMGLELSPENVSALETRTEGWITGLQLAAISMQGREDLSGFIEAFAGSHRFVLDYLVEEVLHRQPEHVQTFLLQTAILDRLTGPLCDAVTGRDDGSATLETLERANLFIVPLDDRREWYRYHRLFADLLRARLGQAQPDRVPELHRRASQWYERNGLIAQAVHHALAARDFERTVHLIEGNALQMLMRGELTTLLGWLAALPDGLVRARPWLSIYHAWALLLTGQLEGVEPRLRDAEQAVQADSQDMLGHVAAIRAYAAAIRGDMPRAVELGRQALKRLPDENLVVRSVVAFMLGGVSLLSGDVAGASQALAEASATGRMAGNIHAAVPALSNLASLQVVQGRLHQAADTYREALELATGRGGQPLPVAATAYSGMSHLLYEWNDLEAAKRHVVKGLEMSQQWGNVDTLANGYVTLARALQAQGDAEGALDALRKAEEVVRKHTMTPMTATGVAAYRARLWLAQGNVAAASRWVRERELRPDDQLDYVREAEHVALARVLLAQDGLDEAVKLLVRLRQAAEAGGRMGSAIEILALQAVVLQAQGDTVQAMNSLQQALSLAEPEGYVRTFVDEGPAMEQLLRRALSQGIAPNYVARLLAAFRETAEPISPAVQLLIEPLSERELEVLRLVAAGLTNREIAQELFIAVSTVKSHTNSIFGKLDVKSRTQAVARARELGLL